MASTGYLLKGDDEYCKPSNNLSDLVNVSTARLNLGLVIGSNVQAYSANLDSLSAFATDTDTTLAANSDTRLATQKAIKSYVDNVATGLSWKQPVRLATTAARTLATDFEVGDTIDGVILDLNDRVLIKNQADSKENGIYVVNSSGAPTRASDANADSEMPQSTVLVKAGTVNADTQWTCINDQVTIGSSLIFYTQIAGAGTYTNGTGLNLSGNQFSIDSTVVTLSGSQTLTNKSIAASQLTGQASVANGGTGASTLTQYGVVVGNGTSAVSVTAAGTANHVLTGNGSANPTFQALPTATSGTSVLSSAFNLSSSSGTYEDIGLSVTLPSAGTYWVSYTLFGQIQVATGTDGYFNAKLYNSTDAADVANSTVIFCYQRLAENINALESVTMSMPITVAASKTIKVYVSRNNGTTYTYSAVESNSTGYSSISYFKLSN